MYKRAGIDRRLFSKIRSNRDYKTSKHTAVALAIALQLNRQEFKKLLEAAGFTLSHNDTFDLVIQFCLENKIYDMDDVNQALEHVGVTVLN
ncbi:hypothetical protein KO561_04780 [Radiobacillus kanasensis]|uniref:hypothetical protein n=1 Tax=Radiobacillus kanasensis TaxID=2844358 RepID=UPI001E33CA5C|nr:hypothetical protein [Radiobacillus kanasensis]UFU00271.1 hypothetical protein KO561_04780 [Radiobacillus kanasensis]